MRKTKRRRRTEVQEKKGNNHLIPALEIPEDVRCICAAGAGGKTGLLYHLAREYRESDRKVLLTTTTKMYLPKENQVLDCTACDILRRLDRDGFVVAGTHVCGGQKMGPLSTEIWEQVAVGADLLLVEADGSRRLPLKVPGIGEPVIPVECDFLIVVEGMSGIGRPLQAVCHRTSQAAAVLNCREDQVVTEEMAAQLARRGYQKYLAGVRAGCFFLNQADVLEEWQRKKIAREMAGTEFVMGSLKEGYYLRGIIRKEQTATSLWY